MLTFFITIMLVALFTAFIVQFLGKTGLRDYVIEYSNIALLSKMFNCDFCISFWTAMTTCIIAILFFNSPLYFIAIPFFSTPVTRFLVL